MGVEGESPPARVEVPVDGQDVAVEEAVLYPEAVEGAADQ